MTERSLLFIPGIRPDRFDKARNAGADGVILDLEDAVPADRKAAARQAVMPWLSADRRGTPRDPALRDLPRDAPVAVAIIPPPG